MTTIAKIAGLLIAISLTSTGCRKKGCIDPEADNFNSEAKVDDGSCTYTNTPPNFYLSSPAEGQSFGLNDTLFVLGTVESAYPLHGYEIRIMDNQYNDTMFSVHQHNHLSEMSLQASWINNVSSMSDVLIEIKAFINHEGDFVTKNLKVVCLPN